MNQDDKAKELVKIDAEIQQAMANIFNKPAGKDDMKDHRKYGNLGREIDLLTHSDAAQMVLDQQFHSMYECFATGVNKYLTDNPLAMGQLLAIGMAFNAVHATEPDNFILYEPDADAKYLAKERARELGTQPEATPEPKKIEPKRIYPELSDEGRALLLEFVGEWQKTVSPLLAKRIEIYGHDKLAAEGLEKVVREWLGTHAENFPKMVWPLNPRQKGLLQPDFNRIIGILEALNSNEHCKGYFDTLLSDMLSAKRPEKVSQDLEEIKECFECDEKHISPYAIHALSKELAKLDHHIEFMLDGKGERQIRDLRLAFIQYVEVPYCDAPQILKDSLTSRFTGGPRPVTEPQFRY